MKAVDVLTGITTAIEEMAKTLKDPVERAATESAAAVVRVVVSLLGDKTPEECAVLLQQLREHGAKPIGQDELDAQKTAAIARAARNAGPSTY